MVTMSNPSKIYWIEMNQLAPDLLSLRLSLGHISARSFKRIKNKINCQVKSLFVHNLRGWVKRCDYDCIFESEGAKLLTGRN